MAALNAKSAYEKFIDSHKFMRAPKFEDLKLQTAESEMRWTYAEKNEDIFTGLSNHFSSSSQSCHDMKPYQKSLDQPYE